MRRVSLAFLFLAFGCTSATSVEADSPPPPPPPSPTVPAVVGVRFAAAQDSLDSDLRLVQTDTKLSAKTPDETIVEQKPSGGTPYEAGTTVKIRVVVSIKPVHVPNLLPRSLAKAKAVLLDLSLKPYVWEKPSTQREGVILKQSPIAGEAVAPGSRVTLVVVSPHVCGEPLNPWCYSVTSGGSVIYDAPGNLCNYLDCITTFWSSTNGYVIQCADGEFSHSGGVSGSCSSHDGNWRPLYAP